MSAQMRGLGVVVAAVVLLEAIQASAYCDPGLQRWINRDPTGEGSGAAPYTYVGCDPLSQADPWGLWEVYTTAGVDAFFVLGFHFGVSVVVWDSKDPGRMGLYRDFGAGAGLDVGVGTGAGFVSDRIAGRGSCVDLNSGIWSGSLTGNPGKPWQITGGQLQVGPGGGVAYSNTESKPVWTLQEVWDWVKRTIKKKLNMS
jgi:hypothetical protein